MKIAIRLSQKINSRIHNSRIAIRQRIAQLGIQIIKISKTSSMIISSLDVLIQSHLLLTKRITFNCVLDPVMLRQILRLFKKSAVFTELKSVDFRQFRPRNDCVLNPQEWSLIRSTGG